MYAGSHHLIDDAADAVSLGKSKGTTVGFDDINVHKGGGSVEIPDNYNKLDWSNMYAVDPSIYLKNLKAEGSGWFNGVTSGTQAAYSDGESMVYSANNTFSLTSVELTAGWDKSLSVEVVGFDKNFNQIFDKKVTINDKTPTLVTLNLTGLHELEFRTSKEKADPVWAKKGLIGPFVIYDDFKFPASKSAVANGHDPFAHNAQSDTAHHFSFGMQHADLHLHAGVIA